MTADNRRSQRILKAFRREGNQTFKSRSSQPSAHTFAVHFINWTERKCFWFKIFPFLPTVDFIYLANPSHWFSFKWPSFFLNSHHFEYSLKITEGAILFPPILFQGLSILLLCRNQKRNVCRWCMWPVGQHAGHLLSQLLQTSRRPHTQGFLSRKKLVPSISIRNFYPEVQDGLKGVHKRPENICNILHVWAFFWWAGLLFPLEARAEDPIWASSSAPNLVLPPLSTLHGQTDFLQFQDVSTDGTFRRERTGHWCPMAALWGHWRLAVSLCWCTQLGSGLLPSALC